MSMTTFGTIFGSVGVVIAVASLIWTLRFLSRGARATGQVVHQELKRDRSNGNLAVTRYPIVEFQPAGGDVVRVTGKVGTTMGGLEVGAFVPVVYDPEHPHKALIGTWMQTWGMTAIGVMFALAGFGFALLGMSGMAGTD
jgi:hypothetical protein